MEGKHVPLKDTIDGFEEIVQGKLDDLPEQAFYMVGNIAEVQREGAAARAEELSPMVAEKIELEIVTPKGRALLASVDEVTAPSVQGEFGVLPGHLPLLAALRAGHRDLPRRERHQALRRGPGVRARRGRTSSSS